MDKRKVYFRMMAIVHETLYGLLRNPRRVLERAGLRPGQRVLELGCGPGFFTVPAGEIAGLSGSLVSMDINPIAVEHTRNKIMGSRLQNTDVRQGSAADTGLADGSIDLAFLFGVAHPIGDMEAIWAEIARVLDLEGILAVEGRIQPPADLFRLVERRGRMMRYIRA